MEKALSWEIDDFSKRNNWIKSDNFSSGGCEWYAKVYPKGSGCSDHLSVFLCVVNPPNSLRPGWKRRAIFSFLLLNQSGQVLNRSPEERKYCLFCAEVPSWGFRKALPLTKLGFPEGVASYKLTVEVYIKVVEVVHQGKSTENDIIDFHGSHIFASQVFSVANTVFQDPHYVEDFKPENQWVQPKYYMYLLGLVETLIKPPQSLSATELSNAQRDLTALKESGFKLDWLNSKLEEVSLEWKKGAHSSHESGIHQLEERVENVELSLSDVIVELDKVKTKSAAAQVSSFQFIDFLIKRLFLSCFSFSKS
ncbi:hypothetical protein HID58_039161 [Brassica napus]|uniref:MATH domain-containing protein n=4 Tax=Brassica TaxID=3705 RepID=A0ABQ8BRB8_BRANA|nr:hypothetical protein HID58_039161 [Brassica napus]CAG7911230.1 unnamed protein product [Brassica rapa]